MATLSARATDGRISFTKYVTENRNLKNTTFTIENNTEAILYDAAFVPLSIILKPGDTFSIISVDIHDPNGLKLAQIHFDGNIYFCQISKIRKPTKGNGTQYEDEVVDIINSHISNNSGSIDIVLGDVIYCDMRQSVKVDTEIKRAAGVKGDPKADIVICSDINKVLVPSNIFVSHKKEGGPEAYQQYGGISKEASEFIHNHGDVQLFLRLTSELILDEKLTAPTMMELEDTELINRSIFGPEYGSSYSVQNVQLIGQGKPIFTEAHKGVFSLSFSSHMSLNGDLQHFTGGYKPVLGATFRAGRGFDYNDRRYVGARVGIYPHKLISTRSGLIKF